ncbi:MAG: hypothetical protein JWP74_1779 [Marmoricola sp.]|nr:hypothetical protein [Marmoricola sp.]
MIMISHGQAVKHSPGAWCLIAAAAIWPVAIAWNAVEIARWRIKARGF